MSKGKGNLKGRADRRPVLVLGAGGMLATDIVEALDAANHEYIALTESELDITSKENLFLCFDNFNPRVVINAAAYTDVDGAESNRLRSFEINSTAAGSVAAQCNRIGASIIHISTDYVFNGEKNGPYSPQDKTGPINIYGESKLKGEELVKASTTDYLIVRTSWLYGVRGKNFVTTMLDLGRSKKTLNVVNDQKGSPTYTKHLANGIVNLMQRGITGTYHLTNSGECTWYDFAREIFRQGKMEVEVFPVDSAEFPRPARRPRNSVLDCSAAYMALGVDLPGWEKGLSEYLEEIDSY